MLSVLSRIDDGRDETSDTTDLRPTNGRLRIEHAVTLDDLLSTSAAKITRDLWRGRFLWWNYGPPAISFKKAAPRLAVFDVFDTLITRNSVNPEAPWVRMAELVCQQTTEIAPDHLVKARRDSQSLLEEKNRWSPTLEEIHQEMCRRLGWDLGLASRSAAAEIQAEREMSRPIPAGIELLHSARKQSPRVVYASDMYLPSPVVRDLLRLHGCWQDGDTLWVSSQSKASKRTGELFLRIAESEAVTPSELVHIGDQPTADSAVPRWLGAQVAPFRSAAPNRYERVLIKNRSIGTRLGDAARLARLSRHGTAPSEIIDVATGVVGPFLAAFSLWLLRQTQELGLRRLYFLSRDGEILLSATRAISDALGDGPELRYLYGGRMAWMFPATDVTSDDVWGRFLDEVLMRHTQVSIDGVALRLGLPSSQLTQLIGAHATAPLGQTDRALLKSRLMDTPLREETALQAEAQRELAVSYLAQEGLGDNTPSAVVDVGWVGNTMRALAKLMGDWASSPLSLFVGYSGPERGLPGGQDAYLWRGSRPSPMGRNNGLASLIEMFCAGSHGAVIGYEEVAGSIRPRLLSPASIAEMSWPLSEMQDAVMEFFAAFGPMIRPADVEAETDARALVLDVMRLFRDSPSRGEAVSWGSFPREEDPQGESVFPVARPHTLTDLPTIVRPGPFAGRNLTWPEAANAQTPMPSRLVFSTTLRLMSIVRAARDKVT